MRIKRLLASIPFLITFFLLSCEQAKSPTNKLDVSAVLNPVWNAGTYYSLAKKFFLVGEQGAITSSSDGVSWAASPSPVKSEIKNVLGHKDKNLLVAVGVNGVVLRSVDYGETWQKTSIKVPAGVDLDELSFGALICTTKNNIWLVAGTNNSIIRSTDDARTWEFVSYDDSDNRLEILDLYEEETTGTVYFAAQNATSGASVDEGSSWEITQFPLKSADTYIPHLPHLVKYYSAGGQLFAAGDEGNLLISNDNGKTWAIKKLPSSGYISNVGFDPVNNSWVVTTQTAEIFISNDKGVSWKQVLFDLQNWPSEEIPYLSKMMYDEKSRSFIIIGNSGLIARSRDGGATWHAEAFDPLKNLSLNTLIRDDEQSTYVTAGLGGVIAVSKELGLAALPTENWRITRPGIDLYIRDVEYIPSSKTFVAVGQLGGVWLSEDDGNNWRLVEVDYPIKNQPPHLRDVVRDEKTNALIAAGPSGSIIRSADSGNSWTSVFRGEMSKGEAFTQILYDEKHNNYYIAEVLYGTIYKSEDVGKTWQAVAQVQKGGNRLWYGAMSAPLDLVFLVGQKGNIAISNNQGADWVHASTKVSNDLFGAYADDNSNVLLAVGDYGKILRSEDGENWADIESGTIKTLRRIVKEPKSNVLLAIGAGGTVLRSESLGLDWQQVKLPHYQGELRSGFTDKANNMIVVGRDGGMFLSKDTGKSWRRVELPTKRHLRDATVNPDTGTVVAVGEALLRVTNYK